MQNWDSALNTSYRAALAYAQNSGLREVDLQPSPKRGGDKINMLK